MLKLSYKTRFIYSSSHNIHDPLLGTASRNEEARALVPTRMQCVLGTSYYYIAGCSGYLTIFSYIVKLVVNFQINLHMYLAKLRVASRGLNLEDSKGLFYCFNRIKRVYVRYRFQNSITPFLPWMSLEATREIGI